MRAARADGVAMLAKVNVVAMISCLADSGWGVSLKKLPPDVGWNRGNSGERVFAGQWYCEVQYMRLDKTVVDPAPACCLNPVDLLVEMVERCRQASGGVMR